MLTIDASITTTNWVIARSIRATFLLTTRLDC